MLSLFSGLQSIFFIYTYFADIADSSTVTIGGFRGGGGGKN